MPPKRLYSRVSFGRPARSRKVVLGERLVAVVVVAVAVELVGAGLHRHVDGRAGRVPLLRIERGGLHLELLHGARRRCEGDAASVGHVRRAIERELVAAGRPIARGRRRAAVVERARELEVTGEDGAGREARQREWVAIRQRHHLDALLVDDLPLRRRARVEQRRAALDGDRLLEAADLELEVQLEAIGDPHLDGLSLRALEAGEFDKNVVATGCDERDGVATLFVGDRGVRGARRRVGDRDGGARKGTTGGVDHAAGNRAARILRQRRRSEANHAQQGQDETLTRA